MSSLRTQMELLPAPVQAMNSAPAGFDPARDLPEGFLEFLLPLHRSFTPRQRDLIEKRSAALAASHEGRLPNYLPPSPAKMCIRDSRGGSQLHEAATPR